jgi:NADPH-dependent ferric siderophore reductase
MLIPAAFDWHLLIGDETALPAIARRLEELPSQARAIVMVEVDHPVDEVRFHSRAQVQVTWCHRSGGGASTLLGGLKSFVKLPPGEGYAWAAAESSNVRQIRQHLLELGMDKSRIRAAAYWKRGAAATHEVVDE